MNCVTAKPKLEIRQQQRDRHQIDADQVSILARVWCLASVCSDDIL